MIELVEKSIYIKNNLNDVYKYISDMEKYASWFPGIVNIVSKNEKNPDVVGKQYTETLQLPGGEVKHTLEVTVADKNRRYTTASEELTSLLPQMTIITSGNDDFSHVTWHFALRNKELKRQDEFVVGLKANLEERAEEGLQNLKSLMEQGAVANTR